MAIQRTMLSGVITNDAYDAFIETLCEHIPPCWDNDMAVEAIIEEFVAQIVPAAIAAGQTHKQWCNGECS